MTVRYPRQGQLLASVQALAGRVAAQAKLAALLDANVERERARADALDVRVAALERAVAGGREVRRVPAVTAARRLGVSPATVRRRIAEGALVGLALRSGGRRVWTVELASLERLERGAPGAPDAENRAVSGQRHDSKGG